MQNALVPPNELSKIMGLPGKPEGIDGNEVERYFLEGRIKEIAEYCEVDVVNKYRVWLRYELFRGRLCENEHQASERNLADFIGARALKATASNADHQRAEKRVRLAQQLRDSPQLRRLIPGRRAPRSNTPEIASPAGTLG
jgi:Predicted 3'-5' exonuclease related to the exonuclease domain of PolB